MPNKPNTTIVNPRHLGSRIKAVRKSHNWTLDEASKRTGLAKSTLSKIENDKISPTFDVIQKLTQGLNIDVPQLFVASTPDENNEARLGRRSITRKGEGRLHATPTYEHELLSTELISKQMIPFKATVRARSFEDFGEWVRHKGEEFLYVLSGSILFYSEFYEPVELSEGDNIYYDSGMGHACVSISEDDAEILWISLTQQS